MIYQEIMRSMQGRKQQHKHLEALAANPEYWENIRQLLLSAKIYEATELFNLFLQICGGEYPSPDKRNLCNLRTVADTLWFEVNNPEDALSYAAMMEWMAEDKQHYLLERTEKYQIGKGCRYGWKIKFFIKPRYDKTVPLNWEWFEFIDDQYGAAGGILEPLQNFFYGRQFEYMKEYLPISHQLGCLLAEFSLFTVSMLHSQTIAFFREETLFHRQNFVTKLLVN